MKPHIHGAVSVRRFGGKIEDYQEIHDFLDMSKMAHADMRHRCFLHHTLGPYLAERVFGVTITNSSGKEVSVRDIAEQHIVDDLGCIPSFSDWVQEMTLQPWMGQPSITKKTFTFEDLQNGLTISEQKKFCDVEKRPFLSGQRCDNLYD